MKVWDTGSGSLTLELKGDSDPQRDAVKWSPDGRWIAVGGNFWDAASGELQSEFRGHTNTVLSIRWIDGGKRLVSSCIASDGWSIGRSSKIWRRDQEQGRLTLPGRSVLTWAPSGQLVACSRKKNGWTYDLFDPRIASGGGDHLIKLWDAETGEDMLTLRGHAHPVSQRAWSPDGRMLASCDGESAIIWDATAGYAWAGD